MSDLTHPSAVMARLAEIENDLALRQGTLESAGMAWFIANNTEHCILATRGRPMVPETKPTATWFVWPRAEHSKKPDAFYDLVEQVSPGPYAELFARRARFGWDYPIGDQALGGMAA